MTSRRSSAPIASWLVLTIAILLVSAPVPPVGPSASPAPTASAGSSTCGIPALDLGLVIDRSGSMVLDLAAPVSKGLSMITLPEQKTGLVSYNHEATLDKELSEGLNETVDLPDQVNVTRDPVNLLQNPDLLTDRTLDQENLGDVNGADLGTFQPDVHPDTVDAIDDLTSGGRTATGLGIDKSHQDFKDNGDPGAKQVMVLVSDGWTNEGPDAVQEAEEAKNDGIIIVAIGVGTNPNEAHLKKIATDGLYFGVGSQSEVDDTVAFVATQIGMFFPPAQQDVPELSSLGLQGMLQGIFGWTDLPYEFASTATDPDGDPVETTWKWSDGTSQQGTTVSRDVSELKAVSTVVEVLDDPTDRCPELPQLEKQVPVEGVLQTIPDLSVAKSLTSGLSCHAGETLQTDEISTVGDLIAGSCEIGSEVDTGSAPPELVDETLLQVDDSVLATADPGSLLDYDAADVPDGEHALEACATAVNDVHDRMFCSPSYQYTDADCTNAAPKAPITADGMLDGMTGWAGYGYIFQAGEDPDGDPLTVTWTLPNGQTTTGETANLTFQSVGDHVVEVNVEEDTSARCPEIQDFSASGQATFQTVEGDWIVELDKPLTDADWSCVAAEWVPTAPGAPNTAAGRCPVEAHVEDVDALDSAVVGEFQVLNQQGQPMASFGTDSGTAMSAFYESVEYPSQQLRLGACFQAADDKHDREFCSGEHTFFNVGAGTQ